MRHAAETFRNRLLTTGQAARLLSVTPDTVLKWIRAGKLRATQTAGGHNRIAAADVEQMLGAGRTGQAEVYCWEFFLAGGGLSPRCRLCPVYRFRAARCYEVRRAGLAVPGAFDGCPPACESCAYFGIVSRQERRLLLATSDAALRAHVERVAGGTFEIRCAASIRETVSFLLEFRPAVILVDVEGFPRSVWQTLLRVLTEEGGAGTAQVALLASRAGVPENAKVAFLPRRPTLRRLLQLAGCSRKGGLEGYGDAPRTAWPESGREAGTGHHEMEAGCQAGRRKREWAARKSPERR